MALGRRQNWDTYDKGSPEQEGVKWISEASEKPLASPRTLGWWWWGDTGQGQLIAECWCAVESGKGTWGKSLP